MKLHVGVNDTFGLIHSLETKPANEADITKMDHPFQRIKRMFGYAKVRYRGLAKNKNRLYLLAGFANLPRPERYLAM